MKHTYFTAIALFVSLVLGTALLAEEIVVTVESNGKELEVVFTMDKALHVYKDTIQIALKDPSGLKTLPPVFPQGIMKKDEFTGQDRELFSSPLHINVPLDGFSHTKEHSFRVQVSWQACSDDMCLLPETKEFTFKGPIDESLVKADTGENPSPDKINVGNLFQISGAEIPQTTQGSTVASDTAKSDTPKATTTQQTPGKTDDEKTQELIDSWGIIGYYIAGVLLSFTPCIFPMIPVTISIIGSKEGTPFQGFIRSIVYVFGLALTYAILGLVAALSGGVIGAAMQNSYVVIMVASLFFLMGLSMMDLFHFQLPSFLQISGSAKKGSGYISIFLTGLAAGLVASPCVAPVIVGVLLQIAAEGNLVMGFFKLFALGWGLGTILIIVGTFSSAMSAFPRAGNWMNEVKKGLGLVLMGAAFYYLQGAIPTSYFALILGFFLIIAGVVSGATDSLPLETPLYPRVVKAMGIISLIGGIYLIGGQMIISGFIHPPLKLPEVSTSVETPENQWQEASQEKIARAARDGKPVVLDFGAKWCAACMELEELTFPVKEVKERLNSFVSLKVDMTSPGEKEKALQKKYTVAGFPTLIFINRQGQVMEELTAIGFIDAQTFIEKLNQVD